jgi:hypothetical protein
MPQRFSILSGMVDDEEEKLTDEEKNELEDFENDDVTIIENPNEHSTRPSILNCRRSKKTVNSQSNEAEDPQDEYRKMKSQKFCENDDSIAKQINAEANELLRRVNDFQSCSLKTTENNANSLKKALSDQEHVIEDGPVFMIQHIH